MAHYDETRIFGPYKNQQRSDETSLLIVDAGTGSVTLQADSNDNWITEQVFNADTTKRIQTGGGRWRVLVSGDAEYDWTD
jgi:hypothetical protein